MPRVTAITMTLLLALGLTAGAPAGETTVPHADLPEDFQQILPRGRIASIDNPEFVTADEAKISDDGWVFGVVIEGEARAYSLNLLNRHEIVNDEFAGVPVSAVW